MTSYNHAKYLAEAIESVLWQSYRDFELIIIDDCSRDSSQQTIRSYQEQDCRIRSIFHEVNMGISETLNEGTSSAKGEYLAFIDSDDVWVNTKLEKQLEILKKKNVIVWSEGEVIDGYGQHIGKTFTQMHRAAKKKKNGNIFEELLYDNFILDSSIIFKKEYLPEIGFDKNLKYLNDYRFVVDLSKQHNYYFIEEALTKYRVHGKNTIFKNLLEWDQDRIKLFQYFIREYGNEIPKKIKSYLIYQIGVSFLGLGEKKLAQRIIFKAIRINPICKRNLLYLGVAIRGRTEPQQARAFYLNEWLNKIHLTDNTNIFFKKNRKTPY
jgi:glycosyltransferase involved in cell wall biosynthesis